MVLKLLLDRGRPMVVHAQSTVRWLRHRLDEATLAGLSAVFGRRRATAFDIFFAYRLLLDRLPEPKVFGQYLRRAAQVRLPVSQLAEELLGSEEFAQVWAKRLGQSSYGATPVVEETLRLAQFRIVVDAHDRVIGGELKRKGEYERFVTWALRKLVQPGQTFVDVGANIGYFSLLAATLVGPTGRVVAVEPIPENWALLEKSIALNGFGSIIELHKVAAGDTVRQATMTLGDRANSGSFSFVSGRQPSKDTFEVECRRLDDLMTGRRVDMIKMDIEGAEGLALKGMRQTLEASRPLLLMEYTPSRLESISGMSSETLFGIFDELSYTFQAVSSFDGRFRPQSRSELTSLLECRESGHLDLLLFPRDHAARS